MGAELVEVRLPPGEPAAAWEEPLRLAGLRSTRDADAQVWIEASGGTWIVHTLDARGADRTAAVPTPGSAPERREVAFLAQGLARQVGGRAAVPEGPALPPPPGPALPPPPVFQPVAVVEAAPVSPEPKEPVEPEVLEPAATEEPEEVAVEPEPVEEPPVAVAATPVVVAPSAVAEPVPTASKERRLWTLPVTTQLGPSFHFGQEAGLSGALRFDVWRQDRWRAELALRTVAPRQLPGARDAYSDVLTTDFEAVALRAVSPRIDVGAGLGVAYRSYRQHYWTVDTLGVPTAQLTSRAWPLVWGGLQIGLGTTLRTDLAAIEVRGDGWRAEPSPVEVDFDFLVRFSGFGDPFPRAATWRE